MMRLAFEGNSTAARNRASDWLWKVVGVKVVNEGEADAIASQADGFCR